MTAPFDWFVLLAGMRTGSNLLESRLNAVPGLACHGEAFNGVFLGQPRQDRLLGVSKTERDSDARLLLDRIRAAPGLNGFRLFYNHDPRALAEVLADRRCAKIVLTRNPLESYVSRKIAQETGQWLLRGDARRRRSARVEFSAPEFEAYLSDLQDFQLVIQRELQISGQTAFWIDYQDLDDPEIFNGLLRFLGQGPVDRMASDLVKQNPEPLRDKVTNPEAMDVALARFDRFDLSRTPNFEPRRGPAVPSFAGSAAGLLLMPVRGTGEARLRDWLAGTGALTEGFTRKTLRRWRLDHPGHRSFTVLRHPLPRAWIAFRDRILSGRYAEIRDYLIRVPRLPLAEAGLEVGAAPDALHAAFAGFLRWLPANLNGQTPVRVDAAWASQAAVIAGFGRIAAPDRVIREVELESEFQHLARLAGIPCPPLPADAQGPEDLAAILSPELQALARAAYPHDFQTFSFEDWRPG